MYCGDMECGGAGGVTLAVFTCMTNVDLGEAEGGGGGSEVELSGVQKGAVVHGGIGSEGTDSGGEGAQ